MYHYRQNYSLCTPPLIIHWLCKGQASHCCNVIYDINVLFYYIKKDNGTLYCN